MTEISTYFGKKNTAIPRDVTGIMPSDDYMHFFSGAVPTPHRIIFLDQVHSADVVIADDLNVDSMNLQADALVTTLPHLALAIKTADCAPILLYDAAHHVIGAVHSGWQGTLQNVVGATVARMIDKGAQPEHIHAIIGPCLQKAQFDVDDEFRRRFMQSIPITSDMFIPHGTEPDKYKFNNAALIVWQLQQAGVTHITRDDICVMENAHNYYSYRKRDEDAAHETMRNVSLIWQY
jgi:YfiH family protein